MVGGAFHWPAGHVVRYTVGAMQKDSSTALDRAILGALAYHDVFDYPLTVEEIWKWLYVDGDDAVAVARATPADVEWAVASLSVARTVDRAGSYVTLAGRSDIVATRMARHAANERKWRRARQVASVLRLVPFVRFIGVVNTLALDNARPESDIDLFIIVKRGRLWLTRALVTALVHAMGIRRHGSTVTDRVCLSFYVSDGALNLEPLKHPAIAHDSYLAYWVTEVVPLYSRGDAWQSFLHANEWVTKQIPHGLSAMPVPYFDDTAAVKAIRALPEVLAYSVVGDACEWLARALQHRHMLAKQGSRIHANSTDVVVNNDVLKFHEKDRREEYHEAFQMRLLQLVEAQ